MCMHMYTCNDPQLAGKPDEMKMKMKTMMKKNERGCSDSVVFRVCELGGLGGLGRFYIPAAG